MSGPSRLRRAEQFRQRGKRLAVRAGGIEELDPIEVIARVQAILYKTGRGPASPNWKLKSSSLATPPQVSAARCRRPAAVDRHRPASRGALRGDRPLPAARS